MFSCCKQQDDEAKVRNKQLENQIKEEAKASENEMKILILGAGESGKSTILKQFLLYHHHLDNPETVKSNANILQKNVLDTVLSLLNGMEKESVAIHDTLLKGKLLEAQENGPGFTYSPQLIQELRNFAEDAKVKEALAEKQKLYDLDDSAAYYLQNLERILDPQFNPTFEDCLHLRLRTTGICETLIKTPEHILKFLDVGGQRSERKKWFNCFDNVSFIIYVISLSEYDQMVKEDPFMPRYLESLRVFDHCLNNAHLRHCPAVVFFNKKDLFLEKLDKYPLAQYMEGYNGNSEEDAIAFIRQSYLNLLDNVENRLIYHYVSCATDTHIMKNIISTVDDILRSKNMAKAGLD